MIRSSRRNGACITLVIVILIAFILAGVASFAIYLNSLPPISQLKGYQPTLVSQVVSADGVVIKTFGAFQSDKVEFNQIPDNLKKAIIATEDKNFYIHKGFDPVALLRSTLSNIVAGHVVQGASTITQQLARILFLSQEKTMDRKFKELIIAYRLEKTIPKNEILTMYLNNVYLGEGAYGVAAAAKVYFNKKAENLNLAESALIAGLPQAPSRYSPYQSLKEAKKRRSEVLDRMVVMNFITPGEAEAAKNAPIKLNKFNRPYSLNKAPYFVDRVLRELSDKLGISEQEVIQGGYKIYTTLNYKYQEAAQNAITANMAKWRLNRPYQQSALVSIDVVSGKILAYVGGKDYVESQYDRVSQAIRQPGSSFKMFVYTTAMERGLNPKTVYNDAPITIGNWSPHNYSNKYRGRIPLYKALAYSSNAIAVRLIMDLGVDDVINTARMLGITTSLSHDPTIALGSNGVKLIELTNAYGVIANGGVKVEPYTIEKIEASDGKIVYEANNAYRRILDSKVASYMTQMLKQVIIQGTGKAANIGRPAAGKTGTTDSYKDAWFIGFTPDIVTGVWIGNDNNIPNHGITGGTAPACMWAQYMKQAESGKPVIDFTYQELIIDDKPQQNLPKTDQEAPTPSNKEINVNNVGAEDNTGDSQENIPPTPQDAEPHENAAPPIPHSQDDNKSLPGNPGF